MKPNSPGASRHQIRYHFFTTPTEELVQRGFATCQQTMGKSVLLRGLIEFTNHCNCNCLYCGIRRGNQAIRRYRLAEEEILALVARGRELQLSTFVLQGGEDPEWHTDRICRLVERIKAFTGPAAAVTLSCGNRTPAEYRSMASAGADRYLIRFETSDPELYARLHYGQSLAERLDAVRAVQAAGLQTGSGFMTGLPGQTPETELNNIQLSQELELDMVGVGPFIPHQQTPLASSRQQGLEATIRATALLRLALPQAHLPATTSAGSLAADGREQMIAAGANVLMPNITTKDFRKDYALYPGKICLDETDIEGAVQGLVPTLATLGKKLSFTRGDTPTWSSSNQQI
ncbi:[FeFe] hydrogenase H-cluster radical SAM maturase HydE [Desulfosediminicola ganghwensis]|uniref:[FeFe] hydrogenase H-cluster radical SAM maturase HydE n=1 Tax=Desulfosediminicola ganghwensis TaxID=2569540 RepID=UPI0010ACEA87|nr:[FeFe] hydrogenase H-cluster radical SAM maturase HydE [Desulfosediminicola ganghwensis]